MLLLFHSDLIEWFIYSRVKVSHILYGATVPVATKNWG